MSSNDSVHPDASAPAAVGMPELAPLPSPESAAPVAVAADAVEPGAQPPAALSPAACGQELRQLFPALFSGPPKPLKLRIHVDIQARAPGRFSRQTLTAFFRRHTGSTSYLLSVVRGRQRFDLDGQPAGEISDDNRKVASEELARRGVQQESRRAIEEQQRRNRAGLLFDHERTTLTRANFCALKGVAEAELDDLLAIAREEALHADARQRPSSPGRAGGPRGPSRGRPPR